MLRIGQLLVDREIRDSPSLSDNDNPIAIVMGKRVAGNGVPYWTIKYPETGLEYHITYDMVLENYDVLL